MAIIKEEQLYMMLFTLPISFYNLVHKVSVYKGGTDIMHDLKKSGIILSHLYFCNNKEITLVTMKYLETGQHSPMKPRT